jgi:hypothetical protein
MRSGAASRTDLPGHRRRRLVQRLRARLQRAALPRLQMLLLVSLTGGAGFLASFTLLQAGVVSMWLRYLLAVTVAYGVFLLLLWLWMRTRADEYTDLGDLGDLLPDAELPSSVGPACSAGGEFGGGGASSSWEGAGAPDNLGEDSLGSVGDALGSAADADEVALPLLLLLALVAAVFCSLWVVYTAPVLFAELLVDGVLAATLYRRLRRVETRHWLSTALRHTWWPFLLTALLAAGAGKAMTMHAPQANSIGDVFFDTQRLP